MQDELVSGDCPEGYYDTLLASTAYSKPYTFSLSGVEYDLIYRTTADTEGLGQTAFAFAFNRDTGVFMPVEYAVGDTALAALVAGGVSSAVSIGKFVFLAGKTVVPTWEGTQRHNVTENLKRMVAWVRGGAFTRTFKLTLKRPDGSEVEGSYKTVSASYPELLDTSDLLTSDAEYQKKVNDRVYAYNSEVTKWIGTAAEDITPENIAQQLVESLTTAGVVGVSRVDGTVVIEDPAFIELSSEDGGDGSLLRAVGNELLSADLLSTVHWVGKIVKIRPLRSNGDDAFYLEAFAKDNVSTGITEVSWRESCGFKMQPLTAFILGTVQDGTLYLSSSPATLATMSGTEVPGFEANGVGDDITSPLPTMFGNRIDYLGQMQDRLVIGSGVILLMSKPGKYFNWFRTSVLTVADDDPIELFSLGSEDDTISASATYDRNLLLFGRKKQYSISGRQPLTPKTASVAAITAFEDAVDADPQTSGNLVLYAQRSGDVADQERRSTLHQIQVGQLADTPESADIAQQLSTYLHGTPVQIVAVTSPKFVALRTDASRQSLYTYSYLDNVGTGERITDSWSTWIWDSAVGDTIGVTKSPDGAGLLVYMLRQGLDASSSRKWWVACEQFNLDTRLSYYPYADSLRPYPTIAGVGSYINASSLPEAGCIAFSFGSERPLIGAPLARLGDFLTGYEDSTEAWVGITAPAFVTPTNPYIRDRNGNAIVTGRLTLGRVNVSVADTAALTIEVTSARGTYTATEFTGRIFGNTANLIGYQPVVTAVVGGAVGKATTQCSYTLRAHSWMPLTVTSLAWVGQYFNNTRRV
jgi:hypothetical protein